MTEILTNYEIVIFIICFFVHEAGHYIASSIYGCRPQFIMKWYGGYVKGYHDSLTFTKYGNIIYSGVILGYIPAVLVSRESILFFTIAYLAMSCIDIFGLISLMIYRKKYGDRKMIDIPFLINL